MSPFEQMGRLTVRAVARHPRLFGALDRAAQEVERAREDRLAAGPVRTMYQMRRTASGPLRSPGVRPVAPRRDDGALVAVSQRAFAGRPERNEFSRRALTLALHRPGFDRSWWLVHDRAGRVAGYCWTKPLPDGIGLIHTLAVDPDFAGEGVGRQLLRAGLARIEQAGLSTAMLYVDACNLPALHLYIGEGFVVQRVDRRYETERRPFGLDGWPGRRSPGAG